MDDLKLCDKTDKGLDSLIQTVKIFSSDIYMELESAIYVSQKGISKMKTVISCY